MKFLFEKQKLAILLLSVTFNGWQTAPSCKHYHTYDIFQLFICKNIRFKVESII